MMMFVGYKFINYHNVQNIYLKHLQFQAATAPLGEHPSQGGASSSALSVEAAREALVVKDTKGRRTVEHLIARFD